MMRKLTYTQLRNKARQTVWQSVPLYKKVAYVSLVLASFWILNGMITLVHAGLQLDAYEVNKQEAPVQTISPLESQSAVVREFDLQTLPTTGRDCEGEINSFLQSYGSAWAGMAASFVNAATKVESQTNLGGDACEAAKLAVAIGCVESSCGKNHMSFNAWGLRDYTGKNKWEKFDNWEDAIYTYVYRTYRPYLSSGFDGFLDSRLSIYCQSSCSGYAQLLTNFRERM